MKIVIDAREYTSGTGRYMFRLIQNLEKLDTVHDYVILLKPKDMNVYDFTNPRFSKVACPHREFSFAEQIGFKKQLEELKPDLVHFGMVQQPVFYSGLVVTTMQDLTTVRFRNPTKNIIIFWIKQQVYKWVNKRVARKSAAIITISEFVKNDIVAYTGISPAKITVTYEAADIIPEVVDPILALENKQFIMYIGRPLPHKNLWRLVQAFQILQKQFPDLYLVLAGKKDGLYHSIENRILEADITNVLFTDFVSEAQLKWLYENCAAYTFPSLSEGFGLPALEALRHGAPLVSTNATCSPEIYGDAAHYFNPLDVSDIATKIADVLTDEGLRSQLIVNGTKQAAKYSWATTAKQTLAVYDKLLSGS